MFHEFDIIPDFISCPERFNPREAQNIETAKTTRVHDSA
jgi:hypothetical protein